MAKQAPAKNAPSRTAAKKAAATKAVKKAPARKAPAERAAKKTSGKNGRRAASPGTVRVRMYRVGFGDFFLMTVPSANGPQHILIDCGVTKGKSGKGDLGTIKAAVRHMAEETEHRLALIIATHRHMDHIIGFSRCTTEFETFKVDAIWMPFWETEYAEVHKFQADLQGLASDLRTVALAGDRNEATEEILAIAENATGMSLTEGPGGGTNARSLALLKAGLGVKPDYYVRGDSPNLPAGLVKAGLQAEILGPPPSEAFDFMKLADLKKGVGQFLDAVSPDEQGKAATLRPFGAEYVVQAGEYPANAFREWAPREPGKLPDFSIRHSERLEEAVKASMPEAMFLAAKQLDNMLNNQSLVVLFTWKGKKLLFAGDAQGGNWEYWMYDMDKPKRDPTGEPLTKESQAVLGVLDFYKVGHHGSTNATPIAAVEAMGGDFVSMCSTEIGTFGSEANNSEVPRAPLLDALSKKSAVVRSDQIGIEVDGRAVPAAKGTPAKLPTPQRGKLVVGSIFVDYLI